MFSYGQFSREQAATMADNLERMYEEYPALCDMSNEDYDNELVPNEDFENWFYQQNASSRRNMSTERMLQNWKEVLYR
jgi:hypothetical protein